MSVGLNLNLSLSMVRGGTRGLDADAAALIARMSTAPTTTHRNAINRLVTGLKACGAWALMDALYVLAAQDEQAANLNWVSTSYGLTQTGTVAFTAYRGYTPNGTDGYLDTAFNPTTASSPKFTQNSAHMSGWHLTNNINGAGNSYDLGNTNSRILKLATTSVAIRANISSGNTTSGANMALHKLWNRSASNAFQYYASGAEATNGTTASAALTNFNFSIGRTDATSFGVNQASIVHFGSSMTAAQVAATYTASRAYMTEIGAI
jgi:hypothetical protein